MKRKMTSMVEACVVVMTLIALFVTNALGQTDWTKYPGNPVLDVGASNWESLGVYSPSVLFEGGMYKMWYSGGNGSQGCIGYATSTDGINWTKYSDGIPLDESDPVLSPGNTGEWDDVILELGSVLKDGEMYKMWYSGFDGSGTHVTWCIGYATSSDGITWTKYAGNPVLVPGTSGTWDDSSIRGPFVLKDGTTYKMWYGGLDNPSGSIWRIGYATSTDGITWEKYASNPVLVPCASGGWDDGGVLWPFVLKLESWTTLVESSTLHNRWKERKETYYYSISSSLPSLSSLRFAQGQAFPSLSFAAFRLFTRNISQNSGMCAFQFPFISIV